MWELVIKIVIGIILSFSGAIVISNISGEKITCNIRNIILILILGIITALIHNLNYEFYAPLISCLVMTLFYKFIFNFNLKKSLWYTVILLFFTIISEIIVLTIIINFTTVKELRNKLIWLLTGNFIISVLIVTLSNLKIFKNQLKVFENSTLKSKYNIPIIFVFLLLTVLSILMLFIAINYKLNYKYLITIILMSSIFSIGYIYIKEKISYDNLTKQYDVLFECIQTFEDWIAKEQLNLHESKNQLVVLKSMVKGKKANEYIDELIKDKIVIENNWIKELKSIPSGGLKGLLYYKFSQAKAKNVDVEISIENDLTKSLKKLSTSHIKELCRIVGIYFDNAIEAAIDSQQKTVSLEIFSNKDKNIILILSNYIVEGANIELFEKKGYSTKGKGHGKGLFFVKRILESNRNYFEEKTEILNNTYIKKLIIKVSNN